MKYQKRLEWLLVSISQHGSFRDVEDTVGKKVWKAVQTKLNSQEDDAQLIFWDQKKIYPRRLKLFRNVADGFLGCSQ